MYTCSICCKVCCATKLSCTQIYSKCRNKSQTSVHLSYNKSIRSRTRGVLAYVLTRRRRVRELSANLLLLLLFGIPSPTHSFIPGLKPSFSAKSSHRSPSLFFFMIHYMDSSECLLLFLSISVFYLLVFLFLHF